MNERGTLKFEGLLGAPLTLDYWHVHLSVSQLNSIELNEVFNLLQLDGALISRHVRVSADLGSNPVASFADQELVQLGHLGEAAQDHAQRLSVR